MTLPYDLDGVRARPSMYLPYVDFNSIASYICGLDAATQNSLLLGFVEWLVPKLDGGSNLFWTEIVLRLAFPGIEDPRAELKQSSDHATAIDCLFTNLEQFWAERSGTSGMRGIYLRYQAWLKQKPWYSPESPNWIDEEGGLA